MKQIYKNLSFILIAFIMCGSVAPLILNAAEDVSDYEHFEAEIDIVFGPDEVITDDFWLSAEEPEEGFYDDHMIYDENDIFTAPHEEWSHSADEYWGSEADEAVIADAETYTESWPEYETPEATNIVAANVLTQDIGTHADFVNFLHTINNNQGIASTVIIRITNDIHFPQGNAALPIRHPDVHVIPGLSRRILFTTSHLQNSSMFGVQAGGKLTIANGQPGGSFEFRGNGLLASQGTFLQVTGEAVLSGNVEIHGFQNNAIHVTGGIVTMYGNVRLYNNRSQTGDGGGVRIISNGTFNMHGGTIDRNTSRRGGGVFIQSGHFNMYGGQIINNFALFDGGGLFVTDGFLNNVRIDPPAVFKGNIAQNGIRIDNMLAQIHYPRISPGTVSVAGMGDYLDDTGVFIPMPSHAFTNYDINTTGPIYWRVSYGVGSGNGNVGAQLADGNLVPNHAFVPSGTEVHFITDTLALLNNWEAGQRQTEYNEDGGEIRFTITNYGPQSPLVLVIQQYTRVLGHFTTGYSITYDSNGGLESPYVQWVAAGPHQLTHTVTHADTSLTHTGWRDEHGTFFPKDTSINITRNITLYAEWERQTTTLTISKNVTGPMGNLNREFEFEIIFTNSQGQPLEYAQFTHNDGNLILDNNGKASFWLKHGQSIVIEGVHLSGQVRIIEIEDFNYATFHADSENDYIDVLGNDTGLLMMAVSREVVFTNHRELAPPTGIAVENTDGIFLLALLVVLAAVSVFAMGAVNRRRRIKTPPWR